MAVTYEKAHEIVWERLENDELYVFKAGAREYLIDGDASYAVAGGVPVVHKDDGRLASFASVTVATDPSLRTRPNSNPTLSL
jgi:hypothetical protein